MLFTVTAIFSDFTKAIEQYEAGTPDAAVRAFVANAESVAGYDKTEWLAKEPDNVVLTRVAALLGVWLWHPNVEFAGNDVALYGGEIIQTDPGNQRNEHKPPLRRLK